MVNGFKVKDLVWVVGELKTLAYEKELKELEVPARTGAL